MLPARMVVLLCPSCGGGNIVPTSSSGNTLGSEYWSDGKNVTPMLRQHPWLMRCPHCSTCFWLADAECEGELGDRELPSEEPLFLHRAGGTSGEAEGGEGDNEPPPPHQRRSSVGLASSEDATEADHFLVLRQDLPRMRERYLRFMIWWDINDKYRNSDCEDPVSFSPEQEENLRKLFAILEDDRPTDWLLKAEIHRELGEFGSALGICAWLEANPAFAMSRHGYAFLHRTRRQREMASLRLRRVVKYDS